MLAPGTSVGRYLIKRKLAEGGMAEIFLATAEGPEGFSKDVVIKVVRSFLANDSQFVQMFIAEARLASRLNHANVVQIFDFGKHGDSYYLAMEYIRGASLWELRARCRERGVPFPPTLAAEIGAQVARGLQYAHALSENGQRIGVVHRDVTHHNVLLSYDGAVKLTDFGIAKATTTQTAPGMLKGKFAYMAPEQARGDKVDARTDLFALGILLWELLTGGRLFDGDSDLAVLRSVQESLIAPPSRLNPDVPQELSDVVMKALARAPDERFQTAFEMEKALANFVLRNARSVEDTAVSLFVQQLFQEELERPAEAPERVGDTTLPPDDYGTGATFARPKTITATPVYPPRGDPDGTVRAPMPRRKGALDDDDEPPSKTEKHQGATAPDRPRTEQMPAFKRPSRRLAPLPVSEPSIVVKPSLGVLPDVSASTTTQAEEPLAAPRSNAPLIALLGTLVVGLLVGVYAVTRPEPPAEAPVVVANSPVAPPKGPERLAPPEEEKPVEPPKLDEMAPVGPMAKKDTPPEPPQEEPLAVKREPPKEEPKRPVEKVARPVRKRGTGTLRVRAVPYATVSFPGTRAVEVTGVKDLDAPEGSYEVTLVHPRRTQKQQVTVKPDQTTSITFSAE